MHTVSANYYDSDQARRPLISEFSNLWGYRGLLKLLVTRDLTVRYKRSTLGMWWTLLNPLLSMSVLWIVFGQFFRFEIPGLPYVVYLLSGIVLLTFFGQAVVAAGSSIVNSSSVLSKVYVPPEVFAFSAALAAAANFVISLVPLLVIQIVVGVGIPWTVVLVPIPLLATLALVAGLGLLVASAAVFFFDVLDLTGVFIQLLTYLTPTFYPVSIVPQEFLWLIYANPLYSYLTVFRGFVYEGAFAPWWTFVVMIGTSIAVLLIGVWVFSRSWRNLVVLL
ncbi:MAG: ABC transporter permease [Acidimicrobiia bacterium]|nr:ABC transporter permease [Acidimicrobiia bacterium]